MTQQYKRTPLPKNALSEVKLRLSAEPVNGSKRRPSLAVDVAKNQPRLNVYTNIEGDKNNGAVRAAMDTITFFAFLQALQDAIDAPGDYKVLIENSNHTFNNGKRSAEPELVSKTHVCKDKDGCIFISVTDGKVTPVKFYFGSSQYHNFFIAGQPMGKDQCSVLHAKAWLRMMQQLLPAVLAATYEEPEQKDYNGNGGNKGGGYQSNSGGGGSAPKNFDEDMPAWTGSGAEGDDFPM